MTTTFFCAPNKLLGKLYPIFITELVKWSTPFLRQAFHDPAVQQYFVAGKFCISYLDLVDLIGKLYD